MALTKNGPLLETAPVAVSQKLTRFDRLLTSHDLVGVVKPFRKAGLVVRRHGIKLTLGVVFPVNVPMTQGKIIVKRLVYLSRRSRVVVIHGTVFRNVMYPNNRISHGVVGSDTGAVE